MDDEPRLLAGEPSVGLDARFLPSTCTPDGQIIRFAAGLSSLTGTRRLLARAVAVVWLAAIALSLVAGILVR